MIQLPETFHGGIKWQSPSNIALVKYWGKKGVQQPQNPSISMTLSTCRTETSVFYEKSDRLGVRFHLDGKSNNEFKEKIEKFIVSNPDAFPHFDQLDIHIESHNTFPHSAGIASSASSMSALTLCLLDIERMANGAAKVDMQHASSLARLASGSACRSLYPAFSLWGQTEYHNPSSDDYAVSLEDEINPAFKSFHDSILIVSDEKKSVSSSEGHALMKDHPYAETRYNTARQNTANLLQALRDGDLQTFVKITESEAMQLHALMMCSNPSFVLLKPNTLKIINAIREFRAETDIPVCFTLDAGPNVHVLYPDQDSEIVERFIMDELERYCLNGNWISDHVGSGPSKLI